jgi:hypothetical protein
VVVTLVVGYLVWALIVWTRGQTTPGHEGHQPRRPSRC